MGVSSPGDFNMIKCLTSSVNKKYNVLYYCESIVRNDIFNFYESIHSKYKANNNIFFVLFVNINYMLFLRSKNL